MYERVRLPFAVDVSRRARDVGLMYEFNAPGHYDDAAGADERAQLDRLGEAIQEMWQWQWTEEVGDQWEEARRGLEMIVA